MPTKISSISDPQLYLEVLSPDDVDSIHEATLEVIEKTGVRFPSEKAMDIWEAHGATVDRQSKIVKVPGDLIESALMKAPPVYTLAARDPEQDRRPVVFHEGTETHQSDYSSPFNKSSSPLSSGLEFAGASFDSPIPSLSATTR